MELLLELFVVEFSSVESNDVRREDVSSILFILDK